MLGLVLLVAMNFHRLAGTSGVAGPIIFSAAWLVAWPVQDEYSPRHEDISALAALDADHPWIMVTGFLALGLGTTLLGLGLGLGRASALAGGFSARLGALLVTVAGVGILVAGLARNDCSSELAACAARVDAGDVSWHHELHDLVSLVVFLALVAAQLVLARAFGRDARWHDLSKYSIVSGALTFALLVLYGSGAIGDSNGLVQRIFTAVPFVWIAVLGLRLRRVAAAPTAALETIDGQSPL
jgi:hypothetical membrane protein